MSPIRKHGAVLQAWACLALVVSTFGSHIFGTFDLRPAFLNSDMKYLIVFPLTPKCDFEMTLRYHFL